MAKKKKQPTLDLPVDIYYRVIEEWGQDGIQGASYVYNLFIHELEDLRHEVNSVTHIQATYAENQARIDEAVAVLTG